MISILNCGGDLADDLFNSSQRSSLYSNNKRRCRSVSYDVSGRVYLDGIPQRKNTVEEMWDRLLKLSFTNSALQNALLQPDETNSDGNNHARLRCHSHVIMDQFEKIDYFNDSCHDYDNVDDDNDMSGTSSAIITGVQSSHTADDNNNNNNNDNNDNKETEGNNADNDANNHDKMSIDDEILNAGFDADDNEDNNDNIITCHNINNNENSNKLIIRIEHS